MSCEMEIIDAHIHIFTEDDVRRYTESCALQGVTRAVVMGNRSLELEAHEYPEAMRYCVGLDRHTEWGGDLNKTYDMVERHLRRGACVGVKLYPGYNYIYVSDEIYYPVYELAKRYGKPVAVHTGESAFPQMRLKYCHPFTLDEAAVSFPEVRFVMCHFGNPWFEDAAAVLHKNKNVFADLSGLLEGPLDLAPFLLEQSGYIDHIKTWLAYAGSYDRLMFGTDWPLIDVRSYIDFISVLIPEKHHEMVFAGNAKRIYGLETC